MLTHISIANFAIAEHLEAEFQKGMTVITGETGAGKSIMLDAAGLTLGDRADAGMVRSGSDKADIHATYEIDSIPEAKKWLQERELLAGNECLLRRVITREGRSRSYINGRPVTLQDLKVLGSMLMDIHSQHAHQSLLKKEQQQRLLDEYAGHQTLATEVQQAGKQYHQLCQRLQSLSKNTDEHNARQQLLSYQIEELEQLALQDQELEQLEAEHKQLANGEHLLSTNQQVLNLCTDGDINISQQLHTAVNLLEGIADSSSTLSNCHQMLSEALLQIDEASNDLNYFSNNFEQDPARLQWVEERLSIIHDTARKHRCQPALLPELLDNLQQERHQLQGDEHNLESLQNEQQALKSHYQTLAAKLSQKRTKAALKLQKAVETHLAELSMKNCQFKIELNPHGDESVALGGNETINFLVNTNPGQSLQPLAKIASGGELSRISLAIQVSTAKTSAIPTLVFDEVDVGIGGATAEVVGQMLRRLGERGQVICVTHQPQVASQGHHHLLANKSIKQKTTAVELQALDSTSKVDEIARMLGGIAISKHSRAHAEEMLSIAH